jgi:hypothetical protein
MGARDASARTTNSIGAHFGEEVSLRVILTMGPRVRNGAHLGGKTVPRVNKGIVPH